MQQLVSIVVLIQLFISNINGDPVPPNIPPGGPPRFQQYDNGQQVNRNPKIQPPNPAGQQQIMQGQQGQGANMNVAGLPNAPQMPQQNRNFDPKEMAAQKQKVDQIKAKIDSHKEAKAGGKTGEKDKTNLRPKVPQTKNKISLINQVMRRMSTLISQSAECGSDVERLCSGHKSRSNMDILYCLTNERPDDDDLSPACHQYIWQYKLNITKDGKFEEVTQQLCKDDLEVSECKDMPPKSGKMISCLLDQKDELKHPQCVNFLDKIGAIVFADYRLICNFMEDCKQDITNYNCGRVDSGARNSTDTHSQGSTIKCLEEEAVKGNPISSSCSKQIYRLAELQSDDFHLDRNLYFACKDDREKLCEDVQAGEGRVYVCLFQHKFDQMLSEKCRTALTLRQQIVAQDYKASYNLQKYCSNDISINNCLNPSNAGINDHNDMIGLSSVLLCLENKIRQGVKIDPDCDQHLLDFRQMLMSDYQLSPEIVNGCGRTIDKYCSGLSKEGETIHCLMREAQNPGHLDKICQDSILDLLKETRAELDYRLDPALHQACHPVVQTACKDVKEGDPMVLSCLMENLYSDKMTSKCKRRLIEMQYFISRDFSLDPQFFKKCHKASLELCDVNPDDVKNAEMAVPLSMVLSCLYRHLPKQKNEKQKVDGDCAHEIMRVIKNRALNYQLNPELEAKCRHSLGELCSNDMPVEGSELICLQDHYENITDKDCREEIQQLTQLEEQEAGNVEDILIRACEPEVNKHCQEHLMGEDENKIMDCLIEHKAELNQQCFAGVTHFQLIQIKDINFSYSFMKACRNDVTNFCSDSQKKSDVVKCLSLKVRDAMVLGQTSPVSQECINQLSTENLQRHENIQLNPEVYKACKHDIPNVCPGVKPGHGQLLECLKSQSRDKLSKNCGIKIFGVEVEEAQNTKLDYTLMKTCKSGIKKFCLTHLQGGDTKLILDCLITYQAQLDKKCREVVKSREKLQYSDINLNPELKSECMEDITKHCHEELDLQRQDEEDNEIFHAQVIECLKDVHSDPTEKLRPKCAHHISKIEMEEARDYRLDPVLATKCIDAIDKYCANENENVVECLKEHYMNEELVNDITCTKYIARLLKQGLTDIQADPILHDACINDINLHCPHIEEGNSRIVSCLLHSMKNTMAPITDDCREKLEERERMWQYAKVIGSMKDLSDVLLNSPHKSYLLTWISVFLICILILGMLCGRVTKRVTRDRKSR